MYSYNNLYLEDHNPEHYQSFQPDPTASSNSDEPGISLISHKGIAGKRPLDNTYYSSNALGSSSLTELRSNPYKHSNTGPSSIRRYLSPGVSGPRDWPPNSGHQAKRARVENIIRGMTGSPMSDVTMEASQDERSVNMQGDKRAQECPQLHHYNNHLERSGVGTSVRQGSPGNQNVKKEMHGRQMTLRQLQGSFALEDEGSESEVGEGTAEQNHLTWDDHHSVSPQDTLTGPHNALETPSDKTYQGWKKLTLMNYFKYKPDKVNKLMADLLKYELSQALSTRIDSIFKHMPLLQRPPNGNVGLLTDKLLHLQEEHSSFCKDSTSLSCPGRTQVQVPQVQTDALSLVVKKSPPAKSHFANLLPLARAHHRPKSPLPFSCHFTLHEGKALEKISTNSAQHNSLRFFQDGNPGAGHPKMDAVDVPWSSVKIRTTVNSSRSIRSPKTSLAMDPKMIYECAPHVKIECDDLQGTMKNNVLNEGLTTNHLKKAKLMFFFTRYPSSLVLKTFFHDVQFTRCITSQLIKWFSNFREFYYIQMEKHARHAFMEGAADVSDLTVGRESELLRALNMHYNKANDFQVPDRFLEVAEITVREFYIAISMGKDSDPSWKKAIYKGICKLDSDIPSEFKSQS